MQTSPLERQRKYSKGYFQFRNHYYKTCMSRLWYSGNKGPMDPNHLEFQTPLTLLEDATKINENNNGDTTTPTLTFTRSFQ